MHTITQISDTIREVLIEAAERQGRESGFVQRTSKLSASAFVLSMVYGVMGHPETTYSQLCQSAKTLGVSISAQGIEQRFGAGASRLLQGVLQETIRHRVRGVASQEALLQRFAGVYVYDSSCVSLPQELYDQFPGVGSRQGVSAGIKLHVRLDVRSGELAGPLITDARTHDRKSPLVAEDVPAGSLRIADLGYFSLDQFAKDSSKQVYWLSRFKAGTLVFTPEGEQIDLLSLLQGCDQLDIRVALGQKHHIACRLVAQRVPQEVSDQRRRRLREYATRKQAHLSQETLRLAEWTLLITNVPQALLSLPETLVLYKVRWQIELLFKLWKQSAKIDDWRSHNPHRILCELYAKLIAVVIMHWQFATALWTIPARSLVKAAHLLQAFAAAFALAVFDLPQLRAFLEITHNVLRSTCFLNPRRTKPNTYQYLSGGLA